MTAPATCSGLRVSPATSLLLGGYVAAVHLAALAVLLPLPLPVPAKALLSTAVLAGFAHALWARVLRLAPWSVVEVTFDDDGVFLMRRDGRRQRASLTDATYVGVRLVVLHLRCGRFRRDAVVLTADAIDSPTLRRLRTRLRLRGGAGAAAVDAVTDRRGRLR